MANDNEIQIPKTIGEKVLKVGRVYTQTQIQLRLWFQVRPYGNMVERYQGNLKAYTKASNGISAAFDVITTGIYEGKNASEAL